MLIPVAGTVITVFFLLAHIIEFLNDKDDISVGIQVFCGLICWLVTSTCKLFFNKLTSLNSINLLIAVLLSITVIIFLKTYYQTDDKKCKNKSHIFFIIQKSLQKKFTFKIYYIVEINIYRFSIFHLLNLLHLALTIIDYNWNGTKSEILRNLDASFPIEWKICKYVGWFWTSIKIIELLLVNYYENVKVFIQ